MRVAEVDVSLRLLEPHDGRLRSRPWQLGGHVDPGASRGQMEVVDGGQVVDLEPVFAGREDGGDLGPVLGCEVDLVGIRVVRGSDGPDELR